MVSLVTLQASLWISICHQVKKLVLPLSRGHSSIVQNEAVMTAHGAWVVEKKTETLELMMPELYKQKYDWVLYLLMIADAHQWFYLSTTAMHINRFIF